MASTNPNGSVCVDRSSQWGNPYVVTISYQEVPGDPMEPEGIRAAERSMAAALFESYAKARLQAFPDWLEPLRGKDLLCFCPEGEECHGDVLLQLVNDEHKDNTESEN